MSGLAPRVRPCKRCGHLHSQSMIIRKRSVQGTLYRGRDCLEWHTDWAEAAADQCDHWALEEAVA